MSNLTANILLENVNLEDNLDLLHIINKVNDDVKLQFNLPVESVVEMFICYVEHHADHIKDISNYSCICPEVYCNEDENSKQYFFTLNSIDDEDSESDIEFLLTELKRQFGINFKNDCSLYNLFRVLLMDCSDYDIINDELVIKMYYESYKASWIKEYLNNKEI